MLSVYTRHHPDCKNAGDKSWRRCSCPSGSGDLSTATAFARAPGSIAGGGRRTSTATERGIAAGKSSCRKAGSSRRRGGSGREGPNSARPQKPREIVSPHTHCHGFEHPALTTWRVASPADEDLPRFSSQEWWRVWLLWPGSDLCKYSIYRRRYCRSVRIP
jgi:hypothetical protein